MLPRPAASRHDAKSPPSISSSVKPHPRSTLDQAYQVSRLIRKWVGVFWVSYSVLGLSYTAFWTWGYALPNTKQSIISFEEMSANSLGRACQSNRQGLHCADRRRSTSNALPAHNSLSGRGKRVLTQAPWVHSSCIGSQRPWGPNRG